MYINTIFVIEEIRILYIFIENNFIVVKWLFGVIFFFFKQYKEIPKTINSNLLRCHDTGRRYGVERQK